MNSALKILSLRVTHKQFSLKKRFFVENFFASLPFAVPRVIVIFRIGRLSIMEEICLLATEKWRNSGGIFQRLINQILSLIFGVKFSKNIVFEPLLQSQMLQHDVFSNSQGRHDRYFLQQCIH